MVGVLQNRIGLAPDDVLEVLAQVERKAGVSGGVVPPVTPEEPAPEVLMRPERVLTKEQAQALEKALPVPGTVEVQGERGWKNPNLWVSLATLAGMLVQVPLEKRLTPQELIAVACVAVAYIVMQGLVDIANPMHHATVKALPGFELPWQPLLTDDEDGPLGTLIEVFDDLDRIAVDEVIHLVDDQRPAGCKALGRLIHHAVDGSGRQLVALFGDAHCLEHGLQERFSCPGGATFDVIGVRPGGHVGSRRRLPIARGAVHAHDAGQVGRAGFGRLQGLQALPHVEQRRCAAIDRMSVLRHFLVSLL